MKVTIDLENLEQLCEEAIEKNICEIISQQIDKSVRDYIDRKAKDIISKKVSDNFQRFVDEYIQTTKIRTGGDYWGDEEAKEYTVEQFIKKELKDRLDSKKLQVRKSSRNRSGYSSDYESVTFEEYIKNSFNADEIISDKLDKFMDDVRKDINAAMKETFDNSTKSMLSNTVLNILSANETYRQIESNIKCIADKRANG